jgi:hypothetical protein
MALNGTRLQINLEAHLAPTPNLTVPVSDLTVAVLTQLVSGTAAGMADRMYAATRTIVASSNEDLDLAGVLLDSFGSAITFARVKMLYIKAALTNVNNVVVGAAAATQWATLFNAAGTTTLRPGAGAVWFADPADATAYAVGAGASDFLRVANSGAGTSVVYDIAVIGTSV